MMINYFSRLPDDCSKYLTTIKFTSIITQFSEIGAGMRSRWWNQSVWISRFRELQRHPYTAEDSGSGRFWCLFVLHNEFPPCLGVCFTSYELWLLQLWLCYAQLQTNVCVVAQSCTISSTASQPLHRLLPLLPSPSLGIGDSVQGGCLLWSRLHRRDFCLTAPSHHSEEMEKKKIGFNQTEQNH